MDTSILEDLGLSSNEIKIYVALLEEGASTAGAMLKKANIQNSVFHFCINRLIQKGLVSYSKKNNFRIYQAASPEQFKLYLKDKEKQLDSIIPELKAKQSLSKEKQEVEIFEGTKGIITLLSILIDGAKKGDEFLFFTPELENNEEIQKFYERYDTKRKEKGLVVKGITSKKLKSLFEKRKYLKMKYTDKPVPANTGLCRDKIGIITWGEKPKGVLINSKEIVAKQREFFNALWKEI